MCLNKGIEKIFPILEESSIKKRENAVSVTTFIVAKTGQSAKKIITIKINIIRIDEKMFLINVDLFFIDEFFIEKKQATLPKPISQNLVGNIKQVKEKLLEQK